MSDSQDFIDNNPTITIDEADQIVFDHGCMDMAENEEIYCIGSEHCVLNRIDYGEVDTSDLFSWLGY